VLFATLGILTVVGLMAAILSKRVAPMVALTALPVVASLCAGFGLQTGKFMLTDSRS
jgi:citrate-Mg2+:H+ or citrate-Ca2+:H+ symporter, CitMHS family